MDGEEKERLPEEGQEGTRIPKPRRKAARAALILLMLIAAGAAGVLFYLRSEGRKALRAGAEDAAGGSADLLITYKGKEYQYNEGIVNFLCMGIDKAISMEDKVEKTRGQGNADAIMLVSVNLADRTVQILAIPRDTMVPVKVYDTGGNFLRSEEGHITNQHTYGLTEEKGCELMREAVSNLLYKIPIQRYCSINMQAVPMINDAIGGVDVEVLENMQGTHRNYEKGDRLHLEGEMALEYIRKRDKEIFGGVMLRLERQKQYLTNSFEAAKQAVKADLTLPVTIYQELLDNHYMYTDITAADLTYLVPELLDISMDPESMSMIPGELTKPGEYVEYHVQEEELKELVIRKFYKEVR